MAQTIEHNEHLQILFAIFITLISREYVFMTHGYVIMLLGHSVSWNSSINIRHVYSPAIK